MYSQATTQESQTQDIMPYGKRKRAASSSSGRGKRPKFSVSRPRGTPSSATGRAIIPLTKNFDFDFTADPSIALQFGHNGVKINNSAEAVQGLDSLAAVFELIRVHHVEITVMPSANKLDYDRQTLATGVTNIPYMYEAVDYVDPNGSRTLGQIQQNASCKTHLFDKPFKRTLYPRLQGTSEVVDMGKSGNQQFMQSDNSGSNTIWNGFVMYGDMVNQVWTYGSGRIVCKIFYECCMTR